MGTAQGHQSNSSPQSPGIITRWSRSNARHEFVSKRHLHETHRDTTPVRTYPVTYDIDRHLMYEMAAGWAQQALGPNACMK